MVVSNFVFLKEEMPDLARFGEEAEALAHGFPKYSLVALRSYVEVVVDLLIGELQLHIEKGALSDRLHNHLFKRHVDHRIIKKMHYLRKMGNKAAHSHEHSRVFSSSEIFGALEEAFILGVWFYGCYGVGKIEPDNMVFQIPNNNAYSVDEIEALTGTLDDKNNQLAKVLAELEGVKVAERKAQDSIEGMQAQLNEAQIAQHAARSQAVTESFDLRDDVTTRRSNLLEAFQDYRLNDDQQQLVAQLDTFLKSSDEKVFLLRGYAGTGKTFITKGLTEFFNDVGRNYILAAPTGKAAKVIASKTGSEAYTIHKTIYSYKDLKEYKVDNIDGSQTFKFYSELRANEDSADTVYIIDEASMISDVYSEGEFFRSGSGYLLQDLFKYINLDHNDHNKKVILIGDRAQLPPVNMAISPALDEAYLHDKCHVHNVGYELTKVLRQEEGSGVLKNSMQLRESMESKVFNKLDFDLEDVDVEHLEHQGLLDKYLEASNFRVSDTAMIIAASNKSVADYNRQIRERLFPDSQYVTAGDKLMVVVNNNLHDIFISNGDFGFVHNVAVEPEVRSIRLRDKHPETGVVEERYVDLHFRKAVMGFRDLSGRPYKFEVQLLENILYSDQASLTSDENKALYIDFSIRHPHLKPNTKPFNDALKTDQYFMSLRVKFGYAITCHKAQGSEWPTVFVNCDSHLKKLSSEYFRWLYTAITRTSDKLFVLDEPHIGLIPSPELDPIWEAEIDSANQPAASTISEEVVVDDQETYGINSSNHFSLAILGHVKKAIAGLNLKIEGVIHNQYQEAYHLMDSSDPLRINIGYNGKGQISSVASSSASNVAHQIVSRLEPLKGRRVVSLVESTKGKEEREFLEPFLKELYDLLLAKCRIGGVEIVDVIPQEWAELYRFSRGDEFATIRFIYNGKDQFTKQIPEKKACSSMAFCKYVMDLIGPSQ